MTSEHVAQIGSALLSSSTALLVASIVDQVARTHARTNGHELPRSRSFLALRILTISTGVLAGAFAAWLPAPSAWMFLVGGLAFVVTAVPGYRLLCEIDRASLSVREVSSSIRTATLSPRSPGAHLPWSVRVVPYAITAVGLALLLIRASAPLPDRQLLVPMVFGFAATMFVLLYESWIQQVVTGPVVGDDATRHRSFVRRIFVAELVLVAVCLGVAHAILEVNWTTQGALAAWVCFAGGLVGIAGCALALASGVIGRKYSVATKS